MQTPLPSAVASMARPNATDLSGVTRANADAFALAVAHVAEVFWRDWDPEINPPKSREIVVYLCKSCGVTSAALAGAIQVAARPMNAKNCGAPKKSREA